MKERTILVVIPVREEHRELLEEDRKYKIFSPG